MTDCIKSIESKRLVFPGVFLLSVILIYFVYWPLLNAPFVMDDYANLKAFANVNTFQDFSGMLKVALTNNSGALGRPVSVLSFLISDFTFPSSASDHRLVNLHIHVLNSILILVISIEVGKIFKKDLFIFGILLMILWGISPINATPVYSVIQRMTSLSSLFSLLAIWFFIKWRGMPQFDQLSLKNIVWLLSLSVLTVLSLLSKESGFLTVGYILIIEFGVFRFLLNDKGGRFWCVFSNVSAVAYLFLVLAINVFYALKTDGWVTRSFSLEERLVSELVILPIYFFKMVRFSVSDTGILQGGDGLGEWITPINITLAVAFWFGAFFLFFFRSKFQTYFRICFIWFLCAHSLESFAVPLELYFEHRNYLASLAVYAPISFFICQLSRRFLIVKFATLILLLVLSVSINLNSKLLSDPLIASAIFYSENSGSQRAVNAYVNELHRVGLYKKAELVLADHPENELEGKLFRFIEKCNSGVEIDSAPDFFDGHVIGAAEAYLVSSLVDLVLENSCLLSPEKLIELINRVIKDTSLSSSIEQTLQIELSRLYFAMSNLDGTIRSLDAALEIKPDSQLFLRKAEFLYSAGLVEEAMEVVDLGLNSKSECKYFRSPCDKALKELKSFLEKSNG